MMLANLYALGFFAVTLTVATTAVCSARCGSVSAVSVAAQMAGQDRDSNAQLCGAGHSGSSRSSVTANPKEPQPATTSCAATTTTQREEEDLSLLLHDKGDSCTEWAASGECNRNPAYMMDMCALSCAAAKQEGKVLRDRSDSCAEWAASGECSKNPAYMLDMCALSCKNSNDLLQPPSAIGGTATAAAAAGDRKKRRLLVIRTNRCGSTAFGGWILRAVQASRGRLEAYRADDGEVAPTGVKEWAAHASSILQHRTTGPLPVWSDLSAKDDDSLEALSSGSSSDDEERSRATATLIVTFIRYPPSQFASAFGSFKSSGMGHYGESVSDTLRRPPRPENWRLDNMNARSLGWGPLKSGAWDKELTPAQERRGTGMSAQAFVAQVEREVDLVLIADHMVESMVMLRRALGFSSRALYRDLAMLKGINAHLSEVSGLDTTMSLEDRKRVCSDTWSSVDCALFEHFNASLWAKVEAGGKEFAEEVSNVRQHWRTLDRCCENNSCALTEQILACDRIRESSQAASAYPVIVQY